MTTWSYDCMVRACMETAVRVFSYYRRTKTRYADVVWEYQREHHSYVEVIVQESPINNPKREMKTATSVCEMRFRRQVRSWSRRSKKLSVLVLMSGLSSIQKDLESWIERVWTRVVRRQSIDDRLQSQG